MSPSFNMRYFLFCLFCFIQLFATGQEEELNRLSFLELLEQIEATSGDTYRLENTFVAFDPETDEDFNLFAYRFQGKPYPTDTIHVYKKLDFVNVTFQKENNAFTYGLVSAVFHEDVSFRRSKDISIFNSVFKKSVSFSNPTHTESNTLTINNCIFNGEVSISDSGLSKEFSLVLDKSTFLNNSNTDYSVF